MFVIIKRLGNGTLVASTYPAKHDDQHAANVEANRLATQFPGQEFIVFEATRKVRGYVNVISSPFKEQEVLPK